MGVKIVSRRSVTREKEETVMPLIIQLRRLAMIQPGFEYEETWRHLDRPEEYLVVRAWDSEDDWHNWHSNQQRIEIQEKIEAVLGRKTEYSPYAITDRVEKKPVKFASESMSAMV
jgi:heme-degrading monooxygenase HmoA